MTVESPSGPPPTDIHDMRVDTFSASPLVVTQGDIVSLQATITNVGNVDEVKVKISYRDTLTATGIANQFNIPVAVGETVVGNVIQWDTTGAILSPVAALTDEQIAAAFAELTMRDPEVRRPGKLNINTVPADLLRYLVTSFGADEVIAEEIIYMRTGRPEGITSIVDLREIPELTDNMLLGIARLMDTTSNVYTICSRGRSRATGAEVEIIAVVDRSTVPVRILEYREP